MIRRAIGVWLVILVLANVNGAVREAVLFARFGQAAGRALSTLILCGIVFFLTWLTIGWIGPTTPADALKIGVLWLALTLAFEFLVGHYVFRQSWPALLEDYDLTRGRIWALALLMVLLAPLLTGRLRGLFHA